MTISTCRSPGFNVLGGRVGRQHDDWRSRPIRICLTGSYRADRAQTIHHGHLHIHQDQIERFLIPACQRLLPIRRCRHNYPGASEDEFDDL